MFHIVLLEPEIPANTGNIGRTCLVTGSVLHLIEPMGFIINDRNLKRAGMDYWHDLDVRTYDSWRDFVLKNEDKINFPQEILEDVRKGYPVSSVNHADECVGAHGKVADEPELSENADFFGKAGIFDKAGISCKADISDKAGFSDKIGISDQGDVFVTSHFTDKSAIPSKSDIAGEYHISRKTEGKATLWMATTKALKVHSQADFRDGDYIMFGKESAGIPEEILIKSPDSCIRIPMACGQRSLNLSNSAAVVLYEALRRNDYPGLELQGQLHRHSWQV